MSAENPTPTQLTFREAFDYAMALKVDDNDAHAPFLEANVNGVTLAFYSNNPLSIIYRYQHNGQSVSFQKYIWLRSTRETLTMHANELLDAAIEGDFPANVAELLLEHAAIIQEEAQTARPARSTPYREN